MVKIIDCPRDAIQGIKHFIPTEKKIDYLNKLLKVGFNAIDFGSFVSPKAIPQLTDTGFVSDNLITEDKSTELIAIVVNHKGAMQSKQQIITILNILLSLSAYQKFFCIKISKHQSLKPLKE